MIDNDELEKKPLGDNVLMNQTLMISVCEMTTQ